MNIPPGFAQVNLKWGGTSLPRGAQTVFGIAQPDPVESAATIATNIASYTASTIMDNMNSTITLVSVRVKLGPNETGPEAEVASGAVGAESIAGVPPQNAVLVRKTTALGGRSNRGRMFLPGVNEAGVNADGTIQSATLALWQADINEWFGLLTTHEYPMYLLHNDEEQAPTLVTSLEAQVLLATQRRRLRKVGGRRRIPS